jgi:hypothetical protein
VPLVLRQTMRPDIAGAFQDQDGLGMCYSLVDYGYLHGIMNGEAVGRGSGDIQSILLVRWVLNRPSHVWLRKWCVVPSLDGDH